MRFHIIGQAQCNTTRDFPLCGFTKKTMAFCAMLKGHGHTVHIYGGSDNEAECDEFVPCVTEPERVAVLEYKHYVYPSWSPDHPTRKRYNETLVREIGARHQPGDVVCLLGGNIHRPVIEAFPHVVEFGVGYSGFAAKYVVWESHLWRAICAGANKTDPSGDHDVIHGFFAVPEVGAPKKDGYLLFLGRVIPQKGIAEACAAAKAAGRRLIVAGHLNKKFEWPHGEFVGEVSEADRVRLMAGADAILCPTRTYEPFGNISPEAQICGTPVIASNWGGFVETVDHGLNGFLCNDVGEMVRAIRSLDRLVPSNVIRDMAIARFSVDAAYPKYARYFERITNPV